MPTIITNIFNTNNHPVLHRRGSLSLHQPEKCGTQNANILYTKTAPYNDVFTENSDLVAVNCGIVILRNHFDRILSTWYHGVVDPRNKTKKARTSYETFPADTFRDFVYRVAGHLYRKDSHLIPFSLHQNEEAFPLPEGVQTHSFVAPRYWSKQAWYMRIENMNMALQMMNSYLGFEPYLNSEKWNADLKGGHHIEYEPEATNMMYTDASKNELLEYHQMTGKFPCAESMWDDKTYTLIEECSAYQRDVVAFDSRLGLLARHGTEENELGKIFYHKYENTESDFEARFQKFYEWGGERWKSAIDEHWAMYQMYKGREVSPHYWAHSVVGEQEWAWRLSTEEQERKIREAQARE